MAKLERMAWPDASLGTPEPGKVYAHVVTPGFRIELVCGGKSYRYHASKERAVFAGESSALGGARSARAASASVPLPGGSSQAEALQRRPALIREHQSLSHASFRHLLEAPQAQRRKHCPFA